MSIEPKSRRTKQRQVILEELKSMKSHPTASDVYECVKVKLPHISLGTVYRNLEFLSEKGEIQTIEFSGNQRRYDRNIEGHHHVRCKHCHELSDLPVNIDDILKEIKRSTEEKSEFLIDGFKIEFTGFCPHCKNTLDN